MRIIAVDDEKIALEGLMNVLRKAVPGEEVHGFRMGKKALEFAGEQLCDVAFLDIEMRDLKGTDLAVKLKEINPHINIIFTTGYNEYAAQAFSMHASGYVMKPVTLEKVQKELSELRYHVNRKNKKKVFIRTFGNFEVFNAEGQPLKFQYKKTKELLAYLVDRKGSLCSIQECMEILWDDDPGSHVSYAKNLRADLRNTFEEIGAGDALVRQRGFIAISPDKVQCDYFDYLMDKDQSHFRYTGEYMEQYGWSRATRDNLDKE